MEIGLFFFGLLVLFIGEITIYLKLNRFIHQLNNVVTMLTELESLTKLISEAPSIGLPPQDNIFFKKEISVKANQQTSRVDVKLDTF